MRKVLTSLVLLFTFTCNGYTIAVNRGQGPSEDGPVELVAAPGGGRALTVLGKRIAYFGGDGADIDIVWMRPKGAYNLRSSPTGDKVSAVNFLGNGPADLSFSDGRLVSLSRERDKGAHTRKKDEACFDRTGKISLKHYFIRKKEGSEKSRYWDKSGRMRFGYENPNSAGALFAQIATVLFSLLFIPLRWWKRGIFAVLAAAAVFCMFKTESRGAFLALFSGVSVIVLHCLSRRFSVKKLGLAILLFAVLAASFHFGVFGDRFGRNLFELNESNRARLRCWSAVPAMMAASSGGWGKCCGHSYCEWFQAMEDRHPQRWLFNSHLTWMVENGHAFRVVYCAFWIALTVFLLSAVRRSRAALPALAVSAGWFVALWFSTIGHCVTLWVIPCAALLLPFADPRTFVPGKRRLMRATLTVAVSVAIGIATVGTVEAHGERMLTDMTVPVRHEDSVTVLGHGEISKWILADRSVTALGMIGMTGRDLRSWIASEGTGGAIAVTEDIDRLPHTLDVLVASGDLARKYIRCRIGKDASRRGDKVRRLVFLSPSVPLRMIPKQILVSSEVAFLSGELMKNRYLSGMGRCPRWARFADDAGLYVPDWPSLSFKEVPR